MLSFSRLLTCFFATLATAANISLSIAPSQHLLNPSTLPYNTQAQLAARGILLSALLRADNTFYFENVPIGSFSLDVFCRDYFFEPLRVDVTTGAAGRADRVEAWQTFRGNEWDNKGEERVADGDAAVAKVQIHVLGPKQYYQKREGFNVLSFLKSPMILMAVFSMAMIFGMPYLLENMDPESRAEFEEMSKNGPLTGGATNAASQIQNFDLAGWMAGTAGKSAGPTPAAQAQLEEKSSNPTPKTSGKQKRR